MPDWCMMMASEFAGAQAPSGKTDGSSEPPFSEKALEMSGRTFVVRVQRFENGVFISISDGGSRIGSLTASIVAGAGASPATTVVIPAPSPDVAFFLRMAAEQASSRTCGIAVVSAHVRGGLGDASVSRALLGEIVEMIKHDVRG